MMIYKTLNTEFSGIRIASGSMYPVLWRLAADIMISDENGKHEVALQQMLYWITNLLEATVVFNIDDEDAKIIADLSGNNAMTLPSEPADDVIAHVLIEKLNVIGKSKGLTIVGITLESDDMQCHIKEYDSSKCILPDISYAGKKAKKLLKMPWWKRPTSETSDLVDSDEDLISINNPDTDILNRFGAEIEKRLYPSDEALAAIAKVANIIEPEWNKK